MHTNRVYTNWVLTNKTVLLYVGGMSDGLPTDQAIGANVLQYRQARGLSQTQLADAIGLYQPTIQKIEAGTRPLRYIEALRICDVLKIGVAQLADGSEHARAAGRYMRRFEALNHMRGELDDFASRLVPILVDLAHLVAFERNDASEHQAAAWLVDNADGWLTTEWGSALEGFIMDHIRAHPDLTELRGDVAAATYAEVLKRASELVVGTYHPDVDPPGKADDDPET